MTDHALALSDERLRQIIGDLDSCKMGAVMEPSTTEEVAACIRAVLEVRALVSTLRAKADQLAGCWDRRERGEACGTRDAATALRAIVGGP